METRAWGKIVIEDLKKEKKGKRKEKWGGKEERKQ